MKDKEFVEYIKKNGWIKPLSDLTIEELFEHQRQVLSIIESKVKNSLEY
jgi:hypothetical protein